MFSDLFWALYWIDVLSNLRDFYLGTPAFFVGGVGMAFVIVAFSALVLEKPRTRYGVYWLLTITVLGTVLSFLPSKQTMYMMLGVKTTENVVESPLGKKLQAIIDAEVDGYLKKLAPEKK